MHRIKKFSESFDVYPLDWDKDYFGISSAKVVLKSDVLEKDRRALKTYVQEFEFVTIINANNNAYNNFWLGEETTAFLCDMNIQFAKKLNQLSVFSTDTIKVFEAYPREEQIIEIAKNSFTCSRFFNDPRLPKGKAHNIYSHWVESAFDTPGKYFAVFEKHQRVAGFLLFSLDSGNKDSTIELIAVDEVFRRLRVGHELVNAMEKYVYLKGINTIKVGTQVENILAIKFYTDNGFRYTHCNAVYHYWPKSRHRCEINEQSL